MLYLHPPYHVINGVTLLPDHEDSLQYYYQPLAPRLEMRRDETLGVDVPTLQLIKYTGQAGSGGVLNFDVHLGLSGEELSAVRQELRRLEGLTEQPRLGPVPLVDGSVRLILLGRSSDDDGDTPDHEFVLKIDHATRPALYGSNRAAFSVQLDSAGVAIVEQAMQGEILPIAVIYSLEYMGLRPAYAIKVAVDWELVRSRIHERHRAGFFIASAEIQELVEEMIEEREILLEVDTFVPDDDNEDIIQRRDRAVKELRDMFLNGFFEPVAGAPPGERDGWDRALHVIESAVDLPSRAFNLYRYSQSKAERTDRRILNANMRERTAVRRAIYPQGHLNGLFRTLRQEGIEMDRFVVPVQLDHPFFQRRRVEVISMADFERNEIQSIHARLNYGGQPKDVLLEESNARRQVSWISETDETGVRMDVEARYTVFFKDTRGGTGALSRPTSLESPVETVHTSKHPIAPQDLYSVEKRTILAQSFPWDRYPRVGVKLCYEDRDHDLQSEQTLFLDEETTEADWDYFVHADSGTDITYSITYHGVDHRDVTTSWQTSSGSSITIRDPFPDKRTLEVIPLPSLSENVTRVFVDLNYDDPENNLHKEDSFHFSREDTAPREFIVPLADRERQTITYTVTLMHDDGVVKKVPESMTADQRLFLRPGMRGHRFVRVHPADDLTAAGLREMVVELSHPVTDGEETNQQVFVFSSANDTALFEYNYDDSSETAYRYRVIHHLTNGLTRTGDWRQATGETLVVPVDHV